MDIQQFIGRKREAGAKEHEGNSTDWGKWPRGRYISAAASELLDACAYAQRAIEVSMQTQDAELNHVAHFILEGAMNLLNGLEECDLEAACREAEAKVAELPIQNQVAEWATRNFGSDRPAYQRLLGAVEEIGELAHAHLKQEQNIRVGEDHEAGAKDAIGDVVIYLLDYCEIRGWNFEQIVEQTWDVVKLRDWINDSSSGKSAEA